MKAIDTEGNEIELGKGALVYPTSLPYSKEKLKTRVFESPVVYLISLNPGTQHGTGNCVRIAEKVTVSRNQDTIWKRASEAYAIYFPAVSG